MYDEKIIKRLKQKTRYRPLQLEVGSYLLLFLVTNVYFSFLITEAPYLFLSSLWALIYTFFAYFYVFINRKEKIFFPQTTFMALNTVIAIMNTTLYILQEAVNPQWKLILLAVIIFSIVVAYNSKNILRIGGASTFILSIILYYLKFQDVIILMFIVYVSLFLSGSIYDLLYVKKLESEYFKENGVHIQFHSQNKNEIRIAWMVLLPIITVIILYSSILQFF